MLPDKKVLLSADKIGIQEKLAILLAFIAGYTDAVGLIKWKIYVSFMSGNTTQLGTAINAGAFGIISSSATVIGSFLIGLYTGTCLSLWKKYTIGLLKFFIVAGILLTYCVVSNCCEIPRIVSLVIIGFSMGMMNTIVTAVGKQNVNTDFVTGTLNSLTKNSAMYTMSSSKEERATYGSNAIHLLILWLGFLSGAFIAPMLLDVLADWILLLPAVLLLTATFIIPISIFKE
ncbi:MULTISPECIES: YoaK family protein [Sphingobacterium]|uniref:YoaK family protein n=1 Tax=Sphingobacterium TaxID=28453 RepID=UPI00257E109C|nr:MULTISPECIES: YoaK family protein [Sphingobacterium]